MKNILLKLTIPTTFIAWGFTIGFILSKNNYSSAVNLQKAKNDNKKTQKSEIITLRAKDNLYNKKYEFILTIQPEKNIITNYLSKLLIPSKEKSEPDYSSYLIKKNKERCEFLFYKENDKNSYSQNAELQQAKHEEALRILKQEYQKNSCQNKTSGLEIKEII